MKKLIFSLLLVLVLTFCAGCLEERVTVDITDGGGETTQTSSEQKEESVEETKQETSEEPSSEESEEVSEEPSEPVEQPEPEHETFSLSYKGNNASMYVDSYYFDEEEGGNLRVVLAGTGYVFNGVIPFENNSLVVPFYTDVVVGESTISWNNVTFGGGELSFLFDTKSAPDQVIVYSLDDKDNKVVVDGSTVPFKEPEKEEEPEEESSEEAAEEELPEGWTKTVETSEEGSDVDWVETRIFDEKGRQRVYSDVKSSEAYEFSVAFYNYYTYEEGSPVVEVKEDFYEYDLKTGEPYGHGSVVFFYTMQNPDNYIEVFSGWSDTEETDKDGLIICETDGYQANEYASDGTLVFEQPYGPILESNPQ